MSTALANAGSVATSSATSQPLLPSSATILTVLCLAASAWSSLMNQDLSKPFSFQPPMSWIVRLCDLAQSSHATR